VLVTVGHRAYCLMCRSFFFVLQNMDSFNIKSDNGDTLEDQPLKRLKCSELMDSEFDKM